MPVSRSQHGWRTTTRSDRTQPLATKPRRPSPPNCISNGLLRCALRAPLRRPLLTPRPCATKRPGSNPSWRKVGGHVKILAVMALPSGQAQPDQEILPVDDRVDFGGEHALRTIAIMNSIPYLRSWPADGREQKCCRSSGYCRCGQPRSHSLSDSRRLPSAIARSGRSR